MDSSINLEKFFVFLENAPEFYDKKTEDGMIIYTFYEQVDPYNSLGVIKIPKTPIADNVDWNFILLNENDKKTSFKVNSLHHYHTPSWFKSLLSEVSNTIKKIANMFNIFRFNFGNVPKKVI